MPHGAIRALNSIAAAAATAMPALCLQPNHRNTARRAAVVHTAKLMKIHTARLSYVQQLIFVTFDTCFFITMLRQCRPALQARISLSFYQ